MTDFSRSSRKYLLLAAKLVQCTAQVSGFVTWVNFGFRTNGVALTELKTNTVWISFADSSSGTPATILLATAHWTMIRSNPSILDSLTIA